MAENKHGIHRDNLWNAIHTELADDDQTAFLILVSDTASTLTLYLLCLLYTEYSVNNDYYKN